MRIENGRLVDYNYYDIKEVVKEAMTQWKKEKHTLTIEGFKKFVAEL